MTVAQGTTGPAPAGRRLVRSLTGKGERAKAYLVGLAALAAIGGFLVLVTAPAHALLGESGPRCGASSAA